MSFWAIEAARLAGIPSVWSVHESEPWQTYFDDLPPDVAASALSCLSYPYRVVFSAISTMRVWSDLDTSRNFGLIRYAHDVPLIRREMEKVDRPRARRELALDDDDICVLLLGTVCERKGQHDLLKAFAALPAAGRRAGSKCVVVGARDSRALQPRARGDGREAARGPSRSIRRSSPRPARRRRYWQAADVFCCTSRIECYPLVILEAMAAGLPIVTTPVYGIAEQVQPSVNALMYRPRNVAALARHLASLVEDESLRRSMAERSPQVLRSLSDDARMNELYRRTILAAAESSPLFPATPVVGRAGRPDEARGRVWFADPIRRRGMSRSGSREGTPAAR